MSEEVSVPGGKKYDSGKARWDLLPTDAVREIVWILTMGADKYGPNNWQGVPEAKRRYYAALLRHLTAWYEGEAVDAESGRSHLAHAGCCLVFLLALELRGQLK